MRRECCVVGTKSQGRVSVCSCALLPVLPVVEFATNVVMGRYNGTWVEQCMISEKGQARGKWELEWGAAGFRIVAGPFAVAASANQLSTIDQVGPQVEHAMSSTTFACVTRRLLNDV